MFYEINPDVMDNSPRARTTPENELMMTYDIKSAKYFKQVKVYKGFFCLGVKWVECSSDGNIL